MMCAVCDAKMTHAEERVGLLDPTSREPLYPLILEGIEGVDGGVEADPPAYLVDTNDDDRASEFWTEAHALSCFKRASFQSSVEIAHDDAGVSAPREKGGEQSQRASQLDCARRAIGGRGVCAHIARDGSVVNSDVDRSENYMAAFCLRGSEESNSSSGLTFASDEQVETVARLSGLLLAGTSERRVADDDEISVTTSRATTDKTSSGVGGWFQYPASFARRVTNGVGYAVDRVLAAYEGDEDHFRTTERGSSGAELDDVTSSVKSLLRKDVASSAMFSRYDNEEEDDTATRRKGAASATFGTDEAMGYADEVISIEVVASACRHLLEFLKQQHQQGANDDAFFLCRHNEGVERVILHRQGWGVCSFGSFCRQAGSHFAADRCNVRDAPIAREKSMRLGEILSNISERGAHLLARTLCQSKYALLEKDTITLFPGGIPCDFEVCRSDNALFQIHVTKITIQKRMSRLEREADVAKQNAVKAQRNNMTHLALVHMRRRKAVMEELERCAAILTNLDVSELRLERARNDVQVVQSYALLKTALQDVRESSDIVGEDLDELMLEIREEMEDVSNISEGLIHHEVVIDEDELNEEFRLLDTECENEQSSGAQSDEEGEIQSDVTAAEPLFEQRKEASDALDAGAVAA